ncbi:MAG: hypothetical protein DMF06_15010 [Verrucomicrobia bacterium]|nr:MAG: hypothetical protein DMF06_15010 [Verrucomicrobiota bacterium]
MNTDYHEEVADILSANGAISRDRILAALRAQFPTEDELRWFMAAYLDILETLTDAGYAPIAFFQISPALH